MEGWTIRPGVLHAPGPYPTFEIQLAQDDAHLASMLHQIKIEDIESRRKARERELLILKAKGRGQNIFP